MKQHSVSSATLTSSRDPGQGARSIAPPAYGVSFVDGRPNHTGLPTPLLDRMETFFHQDFSAVRIRPDSPSASALQADAYTRGTEVHLAPGRFEPHAAHGQELLAHELAHVVQQREGRVTPTRQFAGVSINDTDTLEVEADSLGRQAARAGEGGSAVRSRPAFAPAPAGAASVAPVVQRASHRPDVGMQIMYQGNQYTVTVSSIHSPQITIRRNSNNQTQNIQWAAAVFTILRANTAQDHDLRRNDPAAGVDAYANLSSFDRNALIRSDFHQAKLQALQMIKATALQHINQANQASLNALTLADFEVAQTGPTLIGAGKSNEAAEWHCTWVEAGANGAAARRTWTFVIDSDNPLATSSQDPHVGWTVSAQAGTQAGVGNVFGHVWVDFVPVMR